MVKTVDVRVDYREQSTIKNSCLGHIGAINDTRFWTTMVAQAQDALTSTTLGHISEKGGAEICNDRKWAEFVNSVTCGNLLSTALPQMHVHWDFRNVHALERQARNDVDGGDCLHQLGSNSSVLREQLRMEEQLRR